MNSAVRITSTKSSAMLSVPSVMRQPALREVSTFVHQGQAGDVEAVMVDGRWLMRDGHVLALDETAIVEEAAVIARRAWGRLFAERPDLPRPPGMALS